MKDWLWGAVAVYVLQAVIRNSINQQGLDIATPGGLAQLALLDPVAAWGAYSVQGQAR